MDRGREGCVFGYSFHLQQTSLLFNVQTTSEVNIHSAYVIQESKNISYFQTTADNWVSPLPLYTV